MNKMQLFKHTINYHVAQIDLEAYATEEFGDWIDLSPLDCIRGYRPTLLRRRIAL